MSAPALALAAAVAGAAIPPAPARWCEDHAAFLSPATRSAIDAKLEGYEHATGHQVVVWIGRTIGGDDLADWAVKTFAAWRLGRKGVDDGIAMFVLADDRKIDIEVGYGLEDKVPDAIASRIIREVMTPKLQAGDRDGAVSAGVDAVLAAIEGHPWNGAVARPAAGPTTWQLVGYVAVGLLVLILFVTRPGLLMWLVASTFGRGGLGGFGGGGGGFGGGGGRSGGGGGRGGW